MKNNCVAVVGNFIYLYKYFPTFYQNLIKNGNYKGEVIILTSILSPTFLISEIRNNNKITVLRFKKIKFSRAANNVLSSLSTGLEPNRHKTKPFQWHKINLFSEKMKKWRFVFYLDINMTVHHDINKILNFYPENKLYVRSDGYPEFSTNLASQFDQTKKEYSNLKKLFNLDKIDYFQTGLIYYDTNLISKESIRNIVKLVEDFPISLTNEQGIMNLFVEKYNIKVEELPIDIGDYKSYYYWMVKNKKIIITKQLREKYK